VVIFSAVASVSAVAAENNCHDPVEIEKWRQGAQLYGEDPVFLRLRALWVGLCQLIDSGERVKRRLSICSSWRQVRRLSCVNDKIAY
jgi:hypothetical protein